MADSHERTDFRAETLPNALWSCFLSGHISQNKQMKVRYWERFITNRKMITCAVRIRAIANNLIFILYLALWNFQFTSVVEAVSHKQAWKLQEAVTKAQRTRKWGSRWHFFAEFSHCTKLYGRGRQKKLTKNISQNRGGYLFKRILANCRCCGRIPWKICFTAFVLCLVFHILFTFFRSTQFIFC